MTLTISNRSVTFAVDGVAALTAPGALPEGKPIYVAAFCSGAAVRILTIARK